MSYHTNNSETEPPPVVLLEDKMVMMVVCMYDESCFLTKKQPKCVCEDTDIK